MAMIDVSNARCMMISPASSSDRCDLSHVSDVIGVLPHLRMRLWSEHLYPIPLGTGISFERQLWQLTAHRNVMNCGG